jgi:hypothetical protein
MHKIRAFLKEIFFFFEFRTGFSIIGPLFSSVALYMQVFAFFPSLLLGSKRCTRIIMRVPTKEKSREKKSSLDRRNGHRGFLYVCCPVLVAGPINAESGSGQGAGQDVERLRA